MSVRNALLALLDESPRYGYELRVEFERRTGAAWPLNVGQVYTTLARLERDGLVAQESQDSEGHVYYRITDAGRSEIADWFATPVSSSPPPRDEVAIKLALAAGAPNVDARSVLQQQRSTAVGTLQALTRLKVRALGDGGDLGPLIVIDALIAAAEGEARWLDTCEARLAATNGAHR
jgi:DNA-binding PadR family transcriptional regulator